MTEISATVTTPEHDELRSRPLMPDGGAPAGPPWWRSFFETDDPAKRRALVANAIKARFKKTATMTPKRWLKLESDAFELAWSICREENPIDLLRVVDDRIDEYAAKNGAELMPRDAALAEFLASPASKEALKAWQKKIAEEKLLRWLSSEEAQSAGERVNVDVVVLAARTLGEIPRISFQLLLTNERVQRSALPFEDILLLHQDVRTGKRQLGAREKKLVDWIVARGARETNRDTSRETAVVPMGNTVEWFQQFGGDELISWKDGGRCVLSSQPAKIGLLRDGDAHPLWAVSFDPRSGEEAISLGEADLMVELDPSGDATLFVRNHDVLWRVETHGMPLDLISLLARTPELPIEKLKNNPAGGLLMKRLAHALGDGEERKLARTVAVKPVVELRLENETTFTVAAWARAKDGTELVRTHSGVWVPRGSEGASPKNGATFTEILAPVGEILAGEPGVDELDDCEPASPHAIAVVPRPEDVAPVEQWLARLLPRNAGFVVRERNQPAFAWKAGGPATIEMVRRWLARPSGVTYLGDNAFRKLVKVQDAPVLNVSVERTSIDWLEVSVELEEELAMLSLGEIAEALESSEDEILMVHGSRLYRREDLDRFRRQMEALHAMGLSAKNGKRQLHVLELAESNGKMLADIGAPAERVGELVAASRELADPSQGVPEAPVDPAAAKFLRAYQRTGVDFLTFAARHLGGALLADDMGLGKTLQTLSALTALRAHQEARGGPKLPCLVICPASVAHNWRREAEKFCPALKTVVVEGSSEKRRQVLGRISEFDLVIENSALLRRDIEILRERELLAVAVDEAQAIKNPSADTTKCVKQLRAKHRIALTGTPIENRLTDLWSIVDFISPGYLGSLPTFERHAREEDAEVLHKMLRARLRPLLLRRLKREVAPELPERIEQRLDCEMTEGQRMAYLAEVKRTRMILEGATDPEEWNGERRIQILAALTRLRQICCDPSLVELPDRGSGKIDELMTLLPDLLEAGHKVLLFSQFVRMLELLATRISEKGIKLRMLTGATQDRMQVVDDFEKDPTPSVFLISLKAGGTGLNLTSASHVILYDPWWSPALEAQAIDRSHRIGQKKTVVAIRLVTQGTIEERILELQERKKGLVRGVLEQTSLETTLTPDDFEFLLRDEADPRSPS